MIENPEVIMDGELEREIAGNPTSHQSLAAGFAKELGPWLEKASKDLESARSWRQGRLVPWWLRRTKALEPGSPNYQKLSEVVGVTTHLKITIRPHEKDKVQIEAIFQYEPRPFVLIVTVDYQGNAQVTVGQ